MGLAGRILMKRGMPSGAQTPDGIIFLLALIFSKAPPRYPPHHGAHWAYTLRLHNRLLLRSSQADRLLRLRQLTFIICNRSETNVRKISDTTFVTHAARVFQIMQRDHQANWTGGLTVICTKACRQAVFKTLPINRIGKFNHRMVRGNNITQQGFEQISLLLLASITLCHHFASFLSILYEFLAIIYHKKSWFSIDIQIVI